MAESFRDLLQQIEAVLYADGEADPATFLQLLQRAKPHFLNLLRYKARAMGVWGVPPFQCDRRPAAS